MHDSFVDYPCKHNTNFGLPTILILHQELCTYTNGNIEKYEMNIMSVEYRTMAHKICHMMWIHIFLKEFRLGTLILWSSILIIKLIAIDTFLHE